MVRMIDLQNPKTDWNGAASQVADVLRTGGVAVVPTETVYGLMCLAKTEDAVRKIIEVKGRNENHPFPLAFANQESAADFCGELSPLADRFARRILPGPCSFVLDVIPRNNGLDVLPATVRSLVSKDGTVCCRIPDHPLTLTILGELGEPVVLTSANRSGGGECSGIEQIIKQLPLAENSIAVDNGILTAPAPSTILRVDRDSYTILRSGTLSASTIAQLAAEVFLFVCTGNICRSPMAEVLCEKILAEKLHCGIGDLEEKGYAVLSAGIFAENGIPASRNAVEVMREYGLDLSGHSSQRLTEQAVRFADHIFVMTRGHRESILSRWADADSRLQVLRTDSGDVADPYGTDIESYRRCAAQIKNALVHRIFDNETSA